jgi:hypothetical protein
MITGESFAVAQPGLAVTPPTLSGNKEFLAAARSQFNPYFEPA